MGQDIAEFGDGFKTITPKAGTGPPTKRQSQGKESKVMDDRDALCHEIG